MNPFYYELIVINFEFFGDWPFYLQRILTEHKAAHGDLKKKTVWGEVKLKQLFSSDFSTYPTSPGNYICIFSVVDIYNYIMSEGPTVD